MPDLVYSGLFSANGRRFAREIGRKRPRDTPTAKQNTTGDLDGVVAGIPSIG
jgi:hypothetical protein